MDRDRLDGFELLHTNERKRLGLASELKKPSGVGLALSGGGIRSASFALGVVQALLNYDFFRRVHYLSTVSGGGYLGSAISWWIAQSAETHREAPEAAYKAFKRQFGSRGIGARTEPREGANQQKNLAPAAEALASPWLTYIRQHGNYLQPPRVGVASLISSALRSSLYSLGVYMTAAISIFALIGAGSHPKGSSLADPVATIGLLAAFICGAVLAVLIVSYGPITWIDSRKPGDAAQVLYERRTRLRVWAGRWLSSLAISLLLISIPLLAGWLQSANAQHAWRAAIGSLSLGTVGSIYQFIAAQRGVRESRLLSNIRLIATTVLVLYGLLLLAYLSAAALPDSKLFDLSLLGASIALGYFVNLNFAGLGRLYRDRLMEAFLPDPSTVRNTSWAPATVADTKAIHKIRGHLSETGKVTLAEENGIQRPLHLVNCNVLLRDSNNDLYRNRAGDNFVISSFYSGGNATGWIQTQNLGDGAVTLASAMAISGAAANPDAGPNGAGITRNRMVSFLMSLFNARLGYWMTNPYCVSKSAKPSNLPNLWLPGFWQGLMGRGLYERARFLELSDGGHFDNTAAYELIRRRAQLIILSEAGQDNDYSMDDLANLIERVRVDFSVFIEFNKTPYDLDALRAPNQSAPGRVMRGFAIGKIRYPTDQDGVYETGYLVYLQAVPAACMPADVDSYRRRSDSFPNDTTANQFFDEAAVEAYRELGYAIASEFMHTAQINAGTISGTEDSDLWRQFGSSDRLRDNHENKSSESRKNIKPAVRMVAVGDSVVWGQGLLPEHKFSTLVYRAFYGEMPTSPRDLSVFAHSGSIIGMDAQGGSTTLNAEVPNSSPTIRNQVDRFEGNPAAVDLVLINGGINDVGIPNIVNPLTNLDDLRAAIDTHCHRNMVSLLSAVAQKFASPSTRFVLTGYYPILSPKSDLGLLPDFLALHGVEIDRLFRLMGDIVFGKIFQQCRLFHERSGACFAAAVSQVNGAVGAGRFRLADASFTDDNSAFAPAAWLWGLEKNGDTSAAQDEVMQARHVACDVHETDHIRRQSCYRASAGHPNRLGARAYAEAIKNVYH